VGLGRGGSSPQFAPKPVTAGPGSTTTEAPIPEVSIPAKLISQSRLVPFGSCGALTSYMRTKALQVVSPYGLPSSGGGGGLVYAAAAAGRPEAATSQGAAPSAAASDDKAAAPQQAPVGGDEFSTTNVQEAGID